MVELEDLYECPYCCIIFSKDRFKHNVKAGMPEFSKYVFETKCPVCKAEIKEYW